MIDCGDAVTCHERHSPATQHASFTGRAGHLFDALGTATVSARPARHLVPDLNGPFPCSEMPESDRLRSLNREYVCRIAYRPRTGQRAECVPDCAAAVRSHCGSPGSRPGHTRSAAVAAAGTPVPDSNTDG